MLRKLLLALLAVLMGFYALWVAAQSSRGPFWDLANTQQAGQFVFYDMPAGASTTGKPLDIGDFDGDGCGDIAVTGQNAAHGLGTWRGSAGHVRIIMNLCHIEGHISIEEGVDPQNFFTIYGAFSGDMAGTETYVADFNADGFDDLLFSAQNSDTPDQSRSNAGAAYVLLGSSDFAQQGDIDLLEPPDRVMALYGASAEDRFGLWVEGGDFDGDGYDDLLIGANQADGVNDARINSGEVWIIFGAADMIGEYGQVIDMQNPPASATRIIGADYDDLLGSCVWGDDLNGDGYDDAIVSASLWRASAGLGGLSFGGGDGPGNTRYNSGETFVIFGNSDFRGQMIDLAARLDGAGAPLDPGITVIYGRNANNLIGEEIAVGDMDGNGRLDLILGTLVGDGPENNMDEAGEAWIIYTHEPFAGRMIDLALADPSRAIVIYPDQVDSKAGDTLRAADLDRDGIDDLIYGAPDYDPIGYDGRVRYNAGLMAVIFGSKGALPHDDGIIRVFRPPSGLRVRYIVGADDNDMMPYALAVYDVDGDGVVDLAPNAMGGDGVYDNQINAGEIYVISGAEFMSPDHDFLKGMAAVAAPQLTPTPLPTSIVLTGPTVTPSGIGSIQQGQRYFEETCAGCHGFQGEGVSGLGLPLKTSALVMYASDMELLQFIRTGRPAGAPDNVTGVSMPPGGGRTDWGNDEFMDIIAYLRTLR